MSNSHFNQPKKDWSKRKHAVLQNYLPSFCIALSRKYPSPIWYVDGYAGAGIFRDPDDPNDTGEEGSPVLAARITRDLPYDIRCLNIEERQENFQSLVHETSSFSHVINLHADLNDVIDQVLAQVDKHPAFFFLDPFGTKDLPMEGLIDRIALRPDPTDILVRYATETVRRLAGAYENDARNGPAHARNLDKWFRGNGWRAIVQQYPAGVVRDDHLLEYYLRQLISISKGGLRFSSAYPIRSLEGHLKYQLVFATKDKLGLKLMNDVLYKAEAEYREQRVVYQRQKEDASLQGQLSLLEEPVVDPAERQQQLVSDIAESMVNLALEGQTAWEFDELFYALILRNQWFAQMTQKELRAACKTLHSQGKIKRLSAGNGWSTGTRFSIELFHK